MKAKVLSVEGEDKEIELPKCFSMQIREDIAQKYYEAGKKIQPYAPSLIAGEQASAAGKIRHGRGKWKTAAGKGISRVARKIFWRRGTQFYWQGATIASAVGGRRAHPPKLEHFLKQKKINKKEAKLALTSAISATASEKYLKKRYETLTGDMKELPLIVESRALKLKIKEFFSMLKKILSENYKLAEKNKKIRVGKGKMRGRKYKVRGGLLVVIGKEESFRIRGVDVRRVNELKISDLYPLGRLAIYTEKAVEELGNKEKGK